MGRGTSQAQQHQISVPKNHWQSCKMNKGGTPSGQRAATQKRLRDKEEEKTPDSKTQREEGAKSINEDFSRLLFLHAYRETSALANEIPEESEQFRFLRTAFFGNILRGQWG
jgi:hypothetical protein